ARVGGHRPGASVVGCSGQGHPRAKGAPGPGTHAHGSVAGPRPRPGTTEGPPPPWGSGPCRVLTEVSGRSLDDLRDATGADGAATLADVELEALLHGDRLDELDLHVGVVTGHDHLGALRQRDDAGDVGRPEVELRTVAVVERRVATALL